MVTPDSRPTATARALRLRLLPESENQSPISGSVVARFPHRFAWVGPVCYNQRNCSLLYLLGVPMPLHYAILREANCRLDLAAAAEILAPVHQVNKVEMLQSLHDRPGVLAWDLPLAAARDAAEAMGRAQMPCRLVREDRLICLPDAPRSTVSAARLENEHLVFRSHEWEGQVPWESIRLLDIVQEVKVTTLVVPPQDQPGTDGPTRKMALRRTKMDVGVFLEIVCIDPILRMRIDRTQFRYKSTGLKMHTSRELNFRALAIALHMRSPAALAGPGFTWIAKGNNSHHPSGNTRTKFENFATWLLTVEEAP